MSIRQYSTYFSCLHDEPQPVGTIGNGTHYSVMRAVEWLNECRASLKLPQVHDFTVIWNKDHDERVIPIIEQIYMAGLLSPVEFISLQEDTMYFVLANNFWDFEGDDSETDISESELYSLHISKICSSADVRTTEFCTFEQLLNLTGSERPNIISDNEYSVEIYLRNIDNLWKLGTKPFPLTAYDESAATGGMCFPEIADLR